LTLLNAKNAFKTYRNNSAIAASSAGLFSMLSHRWKPYRKNLKAPLNHCISSYRDETESSFWRHHFCPPADSLYVACGSKLLLHFCNLRKNMFYLLPILADVKLG